AGAWARPTPPGATTGAVYVTFTNRGRAGDSLLSASSPTAAKVEFHSMSTVGGVMRMAPITTAIPIAPGGVIRFSPGGGHVMLTGLKGPLKAGGHVRVVFTFAKAGTVSVDAPIRDAAPAADPMAGMKM
ncbi:MAG TPA: copper chaperone PCu(A)C, partial [Caulobacteraceae bacterium]